jgi:hypothetical protein
MALAALLVTACGSSDDAVEEPTAEDVDVEPTVTEPDPTDPPTTPPATVPAVPATLEEDALSDECLQGDWVLDAASTNALITTLLPGIPVTVEGSMSMKFAAGEAEQFVNIVATFTVPNGSVSGALDQRFAGAYTINEGAVLIDAEYVEGGWSNLAGTIGGVAIEVPAPPVDDFGPLTGGPATCTPDTLSIQYTSGLADAVAPFTRA